MPTLRRRAKREIRKKFKKTIKLSDVDKIWKDYMEYGIVRPLLKGGKVQIDRNFSVEVVGQKIIDNPKIFSLFVRGLNVTRKGTLKKAVRLDGYRNEVFYKIELTDNNYKGGKLVFTPDRKLSSRVHEQLKNTATYFRIK